MTIFVAIHALHTVPPSNINRDDTGQPKTVEYGGHLRLRVSSQSWKHVIREQFGTDAIRTRQLGKLITDRITPAHPNLDSDTLEVAVSAALRAAGLLPGAKTKTKKATEAAVNEAALTYLSGAQQQAIADAVVTSISSGNIKEYWKDKQQTKELVQAVSAGTTADIALFGRMMAANPTLNVDGAVNMADAFSVDVYTPQFDFWTGRDHYTKAAAGAGMLGTATFGSGTLYRHATITVDHLLENLGGDQDLALATLNRFIRLFCLTMPAGKQTRYAHFTAPDYVRVEITDSQPRNLAGAFHSPIIDAPVSEQAKQRLEHYETKVTAIIGIHPLAVAQTWIGDDQPLSIGQVADQISDQVAKL